MESVSAKSPRFADLTKFDGTKVNEMWQKNTRRIFFGCFLHFILSNLLTSYFLRDDGVYEVLLLQSV